MEQITWFNKECQRGGVRLTADISITKTKQGITVIIRNNRGPEISKSGYIRLGVTKSNKNILYFMTADKQHGWKLSARADKSTTTYRICLMEQRMVDLLSRFVGDYNLEISEDNLFFIDRRNSFE